MLATSDGVLMYWIVLALASELTSVAYEALSLNTTGPRGKSGKPFSTVGTVKLILPFRASTLVVSH